MSNQTKGLAALLAAHGRNGDTELIHATKGEVAALNRLKRGIDGKDLPRNPRTGLHEANFFRNAMPYIKAAAPIIAGGAATALTGGAASPLLVGALAGGATGAGIAAAEGKSGDQVLMGGGLGAIGGVGGAGMASGLGVGAGAGAAETTTATTVPNAVAAPNAFAGEGAGLGGANAFTGTPAPLPGSEAAFGTTGTADVTATQASPFQQGLAEGAKVYNSPTQFADLGGDTAQVTGKNIVGGPQVTTPTTPRAPVSQVEYAPFGGDTAPPKTADTGIKWDYLKTDSAASDTAKIGLGGLGSLSLNQDNLNTSGATDETDKTLPESEVYYTPTGERRTRIVDRPRFGNVNMARGGDVYGDYEGVDEAPDGGYRPGGGLNYAGGGGIGFIESIQPGGKWGDMATDAYIAADKNNPQWLKDIQPGGFIGATQPGYLGAQRRREDEERARQEEAAGIAAAAKAKQEADFKQKWDERYSAPVTMAKGGASELDVTDLEHPAARYLRRAEAGGSPIVDKNVRGAAGRVGYNFPVGDTGNFNAGVSGYGMRAHAPGTDPVTRGRLTGVDLAYSPSQDRTISARYDAMAPASMPSYGGGYSAADFGGRPSEAQMMSMGEAPVARDRFSVNYRQSFNEGGISALGHYSDGGQLLRGAGDGVSDSIPASIEGKRPARLADGEFVVPARAVSELGNGSTEAGSKQLYAMLDRIAKKRKSGKGLAYQANPKKMLPA